MDSEKIEKKLKIIIFVGLPRSCTTIFFRSLITNVNSVALFEPFIKYELRDEYESLKNFLPTKDKLYEYIDSYINLAIKENKDLVIKDHCIFMLNHKEYLDNLNKKYNVKFIYLVRHPKLCLFSFFKNLDSDQKFPKEEVLLKKNMDLYDIFWTFYNEYTGKVVISESFFEDPEKGMRDLLNYVNWEFNNGYLEFKTLYEQGIPEDIKLIPMDWYDVAFSSTKIEKKSSNLDFDINDSLLLKKIEESMPFYVKFSQKAIENLK